MPVRKSQDSTNLSSKHAQDLATLIVHNGLLNLVKQDRHCKATLVLRVDTEVEVAQVRETLVARHGIGNHVLARGVLVLGGWEAPSFGRGSSISILKGLHLNPVKKKRGGGGGGVGGGGGGNSLGHM